MIRVNNAYINNKGTATDYGIYWTGFKRPSPEYEEYTLDIPGRDGKLDLTDAVLGKVVLKNVEMEMKFDCFCDFDYAQQLIGMINKDILGKVTTVQLSETDPYYYKGRASATLEHDGYMSGVITITLDSEPYKYKKELTEVVVNGETKIYNELMPATITVVSTNDDVTVSLNGGDEYVVHSGTTYVPGMQLHEGDNIVTSDKQITILYQEGGL